MYDTTIYPNHDIHEGSKVPPAWLSRLRDPRREDLFNLGFHPLEHQREDREWARKQNGLTLYLTLPDHPVGRIRLAWYYTSGVGIPYFCDVDERLGEALLRGVGNSMLLTNFTPKENQQ